MVILLTLTYVLVYAHTYACDVLSVTYVYIKFKPNYK